MNGLTTWVTRGVKISVVVLILAIGLWVVMRNKGQAPFSVNTNRTAVIKEIQELQRLETAHFTIEKVIDAGTSGPAIREFFFGDRLLLIAHANVIAGVDLAKVTEDDLEVSGKSVKLTLPPTEIFMTDLVESKTQVYDRQRGLLTRGEDQLETAARQAAEETIGQAACEGGILQTAADNARQQLEGLLKALEFEQVEVVATPGNC